MLSVSNLLREHLSLLPGELGQPPPRARDEDAFFAQCEARFDHHARVVAAVGLIATILWWPLDPWVYGQAAGTLAPATTWRLLVILVCGLYLIVPRSKFFARHCFVIAILVLCTSLGSIAYASGQLGGLSKPYFYLGYVLLLVTTILPLRAYRRVVATVCAALGWLLGLLVFWPENLRSPYLPLALSFMVCVILVGVIFGHMIFLLNRDNFFQARALQRDAEELEGAVRQKTEELRRLLSHLTRTREDERLRISRELHDELGQEISALRYALAYTRERASHDPRSVQQNLSELDHLLQRTASTLRTVLSELRPVLLDDLGLMASLEWLARRAEERADVVCKLALHGSDRGLDEDVATTVFRITQESLTNVMRHSQAKQVDISLRISSVQVELVVRDDGRGFLYGEGVPKGERGGMGLLGMRERALDLGGSFDVLTRAGQGTQILCRLPRRLKAASDPERAA